MLLYLTCMLAVAAAAPHYDQRQDGDFNVRADVQNVVLLILRPEKLSSSFVDLFSKNAKRPVQHNNEELQERAGIHAMEAFVEPNEPYKVEIGAEGERYPEADEDREVEVVIAGRRRLDSEPQAERDEYKLIGATEQCGPGRERDPVTLMCRAPLEVTTDVAEADPPSFPN
ncbi:uncharacterized protein LOC121731648 [Aricia agestis]|uniref:uncharacterized protein LOC121731648 n=1 Tax=Aricia agestis TaxID=91739 RepID=UPI001C205071|nr:uncharacterized protein LOC121731648 [Aricia agestis]